MQLDSYFNEFILEKKMCGLNDNTLRTYRKVWMAFIKDMNVTSIEEINKTLIKKYTAILLERVSTTATNNYLRHLRAIINWYADEEQEYIQPFKIKMVN